MSNQTVLKKLLYAFQANAIGKAQNIGADAFRIATADMAGVELAQAIYGPMLVFSADQVIGSAMRTQGSFQEAKIDEVVGFLNEQYGFSPETFVDIGANIGTHLIYALKKGGFSRAVGIEPDHANFMLLLCNVILNGAASQSNLLNVALSSLQGVAELELSPTNYGDHRIRNNSQTHNVSFGENARQTSAVFTHTLNSIIVNNEIKSHNTLVWIDTQGHEGQILQSFNRALLGVDENCFMVMEFWPYGLERSGGMQSYFDFLNNCEKIYDVNASGWQAKQSVSVDDLRRTYADMLSETTAEHYPHTDLLCVF